MTHASEWRAKSRGDGWKRQLHALAIATVLGLNPAAGGADAVAARSAVEELRAAKLMETALLARQAEAADWEKMDEVYAALVAKYPRRGEVRNGRAEFLWSRGDHDRAVAEWLAAEQVDPTNAAVLDHLGNVFLAAGDARASATYFGQAVAADPQNAGAQFAFANVLFLFRHQLLDERQPDAEAVLRRALAHFAEASRLQPLHEGYAQAYAETFYTLAHPDWEAALAAWRRFSAVTPHQDFANTNLARVYLKLGKKAEARARLAQIKGSDFTGLKGRLLEQIGRE